MSKTDTSAKSTTPSEAAKATSNTESTIPSGAREAHGGSGIGGFVGRDPSAAPAGKRDGRDPDDHDTNMNGAPVGPPMRQTEERKEDKEKGADVLPGQKEPAPNEKAQPHHVKKRAQQKPGENRRPRRYSRSAQGLLGRTVLFNTFDTAENGENYLRQQPAIIVDVLDGETQTVDLVIVDGGDKVYEVEWAQDENTAGDETWSHVTRF